MTLEEYKENLLSRPAEEHEALWKTYNYSRFQSLSRELGNLRNKARDLRRKSNEHPANVVDFEGYKRKSAMNAALSENVNSHR